MLKWFKKKEELKLIEEKDYAIIISVIVRQDQSIDVLMDCDKPSYDNAYLMGVMLNALNSGKMTEHFNNVLDKYKDDPFFTLVKIALAETANEGVIDPTKVLGVGH